jgi:hypothetical protein
MAEQDTRWRKRCSSGACIEVAQIDGEVHVRDSIDPEGPRLRFRPAQWRAFLADVCTPRRLA